MGTPNAEPRSAIALARPVAAPAAPAPGFSRAVLTGALAAPVTSQEHGNARGMLVLAQQRTPVAPGARPGQPMRPMPVPPGGNRGYVSPGYVTPGYTSPGYVSPGYTYQQPQSTYFGLSIGPNGVQLGVGNGVTAYQQQQTYAQNVVIANAYGQQFYLKAGYPLPAGTYVVNANPGFWDWLTIPNAY